MRTVKSNADSLSLRMEMSTPFERTGRTSLELSNRLHLAPKEEKRKEKNKQTKTNKQKNKAHTTNNDSALCNAVELNRINRSIRTAARLEPIQTGRRSKVCRQNNRPRYTEPPTMIITVLPVRCN